METSWLKEIARDLLALGSIPFYFLVIIRAIIGKYNIFVYQMLIAAVAIFVLYFIIKNSSTHIARSLVAVVFTSLFYKEMLYTFFATLIWVLLLISAYHLKRSFGSVFRGVIIGLVSSLAGYYGTLYLL